MPLPSGAYRQFRIVVIREENAHNPVYHVIVPRESGQFSPKHPIFEVSPARSPAESAAVSVPTMFRGAAATGGTR